MNHKNKMMESLAYHHQHKINKLEKMLPTIQSNLMHQSQKLITLQFSDYRQEDREFMLQPEDFYYLSYQHDKNNQ